MSVEVTHEATVQDTPSVSDSDSDHDDVIISIEDIDEFLSNYESKVDEALELAKDDRYLTAAAILDDIEATFARATAQFSKSSSSDIKQSNSELQALKKKFGKDKTLKQIRERSDRVTDFFAQADAQDGWTVQKDDGKVRVLYKPHESDDIITMQAEATVKCGMIPLVAVLNEIDLYKSWMPSWKFPFRLGLHSAERYAQIARAEQVCCIRGVCPWPFRDREAVFHAFGADCLEENGTCVVILKDVSSFPGVDIPAHDPETASVVRCALEGGVILKYISPGVTHFRLIAHVNPMMGLVPAWFINFFTRQCAHMIFNKYVNVALNIKGTTYDERIRQNEELFGHLRERLLSFAANANADRDGKSRQGQDTKVPVIDVDAAT